MSLDSLAPAYITGAPGVMADAFMPRVTYHPPRIALIDDDRSFGLIMRQVGRKLGIDIDYYADPGTIQTSPLGLRCDVMILDYRLESQTAIDILPWIHHRVPRAPIMIVSCHKRLAEVSWPCQVEAFVSKSKGAKAIIHKAISLRKP